VAGLKRLAVHERQQSQRSTFTHLTARRAHRGQRRKHLIAARQIIEPHHRNIARDLHAQTQRSQQRALGQIVVKLRSNKSAAATPAKVAKK
jgi:hypothetical protein